MKLKMRCRFEKEILLNCFSKKKKKQSLIKIILKIL